MSDSILPRIKEILEFDVDMAIKAYWEDTQNQFQSKGAGCFANGARYENARLKPLLIRLVECVEALEMTPCEFFGTDESGSPIHASNCLKCEALQALRDEVDKQTKGE